MKRHLTFLMLGLVLAACACAPTMNSSSERGGLGTGWGETRQSLVRMIEFERADADRPIAVSILHYDDPAGVRALGRGLSPVPGASAAEGPLRVRLVDDRGFPLPTF